MITVTLRGDKREFSKGTLIKEVALSISEGLARQSVCGKINNALYDLDYALNEDVELDIITYKDPEYISVMRHTASHILAHAIKSLYPTSKLAIGPSISNGFYYDIEFNTPITISEFDKIEKEMQKIIKADLPIKRHVLSRKDANKLMKDANEGYKIELIKGIPAKSQISFYKQGEFIDLCSGPHLSSTGKIKAFKLMSITGAYWKGDEKNKMLTRIYGVAFDKKSELEAYLLELEDAKRRDHNKLGRELEIFMTDENIGQGLPLLLPKGAKLMQILTRFVEDEEERRGYLLTRTPSFAKNNLYKISGHWDHYRDKMFVIGEEKDEEIFALRPMTCPFQFAIYNNGLKSYRDLPIRYSETANLFRKEASGEMHGLIRIRQFTLADGHIICAPNQLEDEFKAAIDLMYYILKCLDLKDEVTYRFSLWDEKNKEKYIDAPEKWESTQNIMREILNKLGLTYVEAKDEAAFYGPKLDVQKRNVYGKEDTLFTIQIDFALAERFNMTYIDEDGVKQHPFIIHRSSIGCYERTIAMLIEKYAGALPVWMSPVQVKVLSLTDRTAEQAKKLVSELKYQGIRAEVDIRSEKLGYKIRSAQLEKIPYMVIIGDADVEKGVISVRHRANGDMGAMTKEIFINTILEDVKNFK